MEGPAVSAAHPVPINRAAAVESWTQQQVDLIRRLIAPNANDEQLALLANVCRHRMLDPFAGEIIGVVYKGRLSIQVTVAGLRTIAERSGLYAGQDPPQWCGPGPEVEWQEVWFSQDPPAAARVAVYRKDFARPVVGIARWASFVKLDREGQPENLWASMPDLMLAKCAEAQALKRAFPDAMAEAGVGTREMSTASVISMEARAAGLDDDQRHALVAEVTAGRTESTREVDADEALELRRRIAAGRVVPAGVDPETGEIAPREGRSDVGDPPLAEQVTAEDTMAEQQARQWASEDALAMVAPSLLAIDAGDQRTKNHWALTLHRAALDQAAVSWSVADCQRVARLLQQEGLWVDPRTGEGPGADPERPF